MLGQVGDALEQECPAEDGRRGRAEPGHPAVQAEVEHGGSEQHERAAEREMDDGGRRVFAARSSPPRSRRGRSRARRPKPPGQGLIAWIQSSACDEWSPSISRPAGPFVGAIPAPWAGLALESFRWLPRWTDAVPDGQ